MSARYGRRRNKKMRRYTRNVSPALTTKPAAVAPARASEAARWGQLVAGIIAWLSAVAGTRRRFR
jgi:hypothetical protein